LRGTPTAQVTAQVTAHVLALVQQLHGELTRGELQEAVGLTHREHFRKAYLLPALEAGLIEMTQPGKPNVSPLYGACWREREAAPDWSGDVEVIERAAGESRSPSGRAGRLTGCAAGRPAQQPSGGG